MLPLPILDAAAALRLRINGVSEPIMRDGVERFPALAYFTIHNPDLPAHGATFALKVPDLTTASLQKSYDETAASFAR